MSNSKNTILGLFPDNDTNAITASNLRQFVTTVFDEESDINEIQNVLTSNNTDKPLSALQGGGRILSYISPLTYLVDLFNAGLTEESVFHPLTDILALILFSLVFLFIAYRFHKRNLMKGM